MNSNNLYQNWDRHLSMIDQQDRLQAGLSNHCSPLYVSQSMLAGSFEDDTKTIICRLGHERCTCDEFNRSDSGELMPCRHLYRLAYEFGFMDRFGKLTENAFFNTELISHKESTILLSLLMPLSMTFYTAPSLVKMDTHTMGIKNTYAATIPIQSSQLITSIHA